MRPNDKPAGSSFLSGWLADGVLILVLCLLALKMTFRISTVRDVWVGDETAYLITAMRIPAYGLPGPESGPLYPLWYLLLSRLPVDLLEVTFINWGVLAALLPSCFYLLLRHLGCSRPWSLLAGFLLLTSTVFEVLPLPTHLLAALLALGTVAMIRCRTGPARFTVLGLTLLVATYVRPEYSLSLLGYGLVALLAGGWVLVRQRQSWRKLILPALVLAGATTAFVLTFGFPPFNGERSFVAFGQHYSVNLVDSGLKKAIPWHEWERLVREDFGDAHSFLQAARNNPQAILWHVGQNVSRLPDSVATMLPPRLDLPAEHTALTSVVLPVLGIVGLAGLAVRLFLHGLRVESNRPLLAPLVLMAFLLLPAVVQTLLIYPRQHYLLPLTIFSLALVASGVPRWLPSSRWLAGWPMLLAMSLLMATVTPNRAEGWNVQQMLGWRPEPKRLFRDVIPTVKLVRMARIDRPFVLLEHEHYGLAHSFYIRQPHELLYHSKKKEGFQEFLRKNGVGVILLSPVLRGDPQFKDDPEFRRFLKEKGGDDFAIYGAVGCITRVAIRRDLLPPGTPGGQVNNASAQRR